MFAGVLALSTSVTGCTESGHTLYDTDFDDAERWRAGSSVIGFHSVYAQGAAFSVRGQVGEVEEGGGSSARAPLHFESADPDVLSITETAPGPVASAEVLALGPGVTDLLLVDEEGEVAAITELEVRRVDEIRLYSSSELELDHPAPPEVKGPKTLADVPARFVAYLYADGRRVYGDALTAFSPDETAECRRYYGEHDNTFTFQAENAGTYGVSLGTSTRPDLVGLTVDVVDPAAIAGIDLVQERRDADRVGAVGWISGERRDRDVVGLLRDEEGDRVYGAQLSWRLGGEDLRGEGDVVVLQREAFDKKRTLVATYGPHRASLRVRAEDAYVHDTVFPSGCAVAPGGRSAWLGLPVLMLAIAGRRRRRSRPRPRPRP